MSGSCLKFQEDIASAGRSMLAYTVIVPPVHPPRSCYIPVSHLPQETPDSPDEDDPVPPPRKPPRVDPDIPHRHPPPSNPEKPPVSDPVAPEPEPPDPTPHKPPIGEPVEPSDTPPLRAT